MEIVTYYKLTKDFKEEWPKLELVCLGGYLTKSGETYRLFGTVVLRSWPNYVKSLLEDIQYLKIGKLYPAMGEEMYIRFK